MRRLIVLVLSGLFLGSVALILLFFRDSAQGSLGFEAAKSLLQLGVVAVVGTVVSILVFEYQQERQAHEKERDFNRKGLEYRETLLLSILSRMMEAYGHAKTARRILRARSELIRGKGQVVFANQYDIFFDMINDAQLDLENLARDIETSARAFSEPEVLVKHLRTMDAYLGELIGEYEEKRHRFSGNKLSLQLSELQVLKDFLNTTKESKFMPQMVIPYHEVQKGIRANLLYPNLPEPIETPNTGLHTTRLR